MNDEQAVSTNSGDLSGQNALAGAMRFVRAVRFRKRVIVLCVVLSFLLGGIYYSTAPRYFESMAGLLVLQTNGGVMQDQNNNDRAVQSQMPTFQRIVTSEVVLNEALKTLPPEHRIDLEGVSPAKWTETIRSQIAVTAARNTNLIEIRYRSLNAETAATVTDHIVSAYLQFLHDTHQNGARELLDVLTQEKADLEKLLTSKEQELLRLRGKSELVFGDGPQAVNVVVARVTQLNDLLIQAQRKSFEARSALVAIEQAIERGDDLQQFALQELDFVGREMLMKEMGFAQTDAFTLIRFQEQILTDRSLLQSKLETHGPNHPVIKQLNERIAAAEEMLAAREKSATENLKRVQQNELGPKLAQIARHKLQQAEAQETSTREQFEAEKRTALQLNGRLAQMEILDLDLKRLRTFYDLLLERMKNIDLGKEHGVQTAIVSEPKVVNLPVSPKLKLVVLACLVIGIGAGLVAVYLIDTLDDRFRTPEELVEQLGLPVLASIPRIAEATGEGIDAVITLARPNSIESEAFRAMRTAISFSGGETKRLAVTSSEPSDGKTTVSTNLSAAFSQTGKRTLLIDADMRRPGTTGLLRLRGAKGLSSLLRDDRSIEESVDANIFAEMAPGLDVIPAGPRPINPAELLGSDRFQDLLAWADGKYDQILIDTPPVLAVTDSGIVSRLIDGLVLVVQPQKNHRRVVLRTVDALRMLGANVVGIAANNISPESEGGYYGTSYGYGYGYGYGHGESEFDEPQQPEPEPYPSVPYGVASRPDTTHDEAPEVLSMTRPTTDASRESRREVAARRRREAQRMQATHAAESANEADPSDALPAATMRQATVDASNDPSTIPLPEPRRRSRRRSA